jgi:hypothetical protein
LFGLKPPAAEAGPDANKPPPPGLILNGITTILGNKRALMKVQMPGKPGTPAKEEAFVLAEGQMYEGVEVLEIDEKLGSVKVNDYGTITNLTFKENGAKMAAAPAGAPLPGGFLSAPLNPTQPGAAPGAPPLRTIPTRSLRVPGVGAAATPNAATGTAGGNAYGGIAPQNSGMYGAAGATPALTFTPGSYAGNARPTLPDPPMTADEQVALHMLQKQSNPDIAPFPGGEEPLQPVVPGQGTIQGNTGTRTGPQYAIPGQPATPPPLPQ